MEDISEVNFDPDASDENVNQMEKAALEKFLSYSLEISLEIVAYELANRVFFDHFRTLRSS